MPQNINGYVVNVLPKDPTVPSTFVADIIAADTDTTIEFPSQYRAIAISVAIKNIEKIEIKPSQIDVGKEINKIGPYEAKINLHAEILANVHIEVVKEKEEN